MAALLALLSSALWGTADYLAGRLSRGLHVLVVLGLSQAAGLATMVGIATVTGAWSSDPAYVLPAVAASLCGAAGLLMYYRALATGTMGVVSPIAALGVAVPLAVGVASGERPTAVQAFGIVLAVLGVVAASGPEVRGAAGWLPVALASGAAVLLGGSMVAIAAGSATDVVMTMTTMRLVTVTLLAMVLAAMSTRSGGGLRVGLRDGPALVVVGLFDVGANLAFGAASTLGMLSLVAVFGSLYPVATILLARQLDGERLRVVQQVGVGLALAGAAAISGG